MTGRLDRAGASPAQRVSKTTSAGTTVFVHDPSGRLLEEIAPSEAPTDHVWFGNRLLGMVRAGQFDAAFSDHLGRLLVLTNPAGVVVWQAAGTAFDRTPLVDNVGGFNLRFPGQYADPESGLYYDLNRYYDPALGRYVQSDPIGLQRDINTYAYAAGNSVS